jgi:Fic family protein
VEDVVKDERPLTESFIRELHKLLLKESYKSPTVTKDGIPAQKIIKVGEYKTQTNYVLAKTGETFYFATPEETPALMDDLIQWYRKKSEDKKTNPILLAAEFHYKFIRIHPFDDGNGRTARILMNFILMRVGFPPVIIKTEDKMNYLSVLQQADAGILEPFLEYITENLVRSLEIMISGAKGESIEEDGDFEKEMALLKQKFENSGEEIEIFKNEYTLLDLSR